jgi:hypothetical protein
MAAGIVGAIVVGPRAMRTLGGLWRSLGHFSTDGVRDFVNARIRERLGDLWAASGRNPDLVPDPVCFEDLDYATFSQLRPLKIIATDVLQMRPVLFDRDRTPKVPIGDAVAASIAIPLAFRPVTVRGLPVELGEALFADGGLVSNLPFWVFNEEKMAVERANPTDPPVPIVAFKLEQHAIPARPMGPEAGIRGWLRFYGGAAVRGALLGVVLALIGWAVADLAIGIRLPAISWTIAAALVLAAANMLRTGAKISRARRAQPTPTTLAPSFLPFVAQTVRTGIFGSQVVAQNLLRDLVQVPLVTRLTVLGFDRPWRDIRTDYISGRQSTMRKLRMVLQIRPAFLERRLREAVDLAQAHVSQMRGQPVAPLRACVIEPFGEKSLRVTHGHNMQNDTDDRLILDVRGAGAGRAYRTKDAVAITFAPGSAPPFMTKYERALLRQTLRSALCIPIFDDIEAWEQPPAQRPLPLGVLAIDSDEDLSAEFGAPDFINAMAAPTVLISPAFKME